MTVTINQITTGMGLLLNGEVYTVSECSHVKPGKGSAFVRLKLKNIKTDRVIDRTYKTADKLDDVFLEEKSVQFLYRAGDAFHFMDQKSYEELVIQEGDMGESVQYLQDNLEVTVILYNHQVQKIVLPTFIIAEVTMTEQGVKGDSARAGTKPATIDTGASVLVPLFIKMGDFVKIDTRTGEYSERVSK